MLEVLYEDNHLIAINKKPGDIVQADKTEDAPLSDFVKAFIKHKYNKPGDVFLGTIHRLDRPTSGVVLFAKTSKALSRMNEQFKNKEVQKTYWAVVDNAPANSFGTLDNCLQKNEKENKSYITKAGQGKQAVLDYKLLKKLDNFYLLEIKPKTGTLRRIAFLSFGIFRGAYLLAIRANSLICPGVVPQQPPTILTKELCIKSSN